MKQAMSTVFKGRVFSVEVGERRVPNGSTHRVEIVRHAPSVVLIPIEPDGRIVIVRQYRAPVDRETWEFPAGSVNSGESVEEAVRRECEEEIGRVPHRIERIRGLYPAPGFCDELLIFHKVWDLRAPATGPRKPDEDEDIHVRTLTVTEARAMVGRGEIADLKTAYALTLV